MEHEDDSHSRKHEMTLQLKVRGLDCAEEVAILKREVGPIVGGEQHLTFDILRARMTVAGPADIAIGRVLDAVARTGMQAEPWTDGPSATHRRDVFWQRHARAATTLASR